MGLEPQSSSAGQQTVEACPGSCLASSPTSSPAPSSKSPRFTIHHYPPVTLPSLSVKQVKPSDLVTPFGQETMASFGQQPQSTALVGIRVEPLEEMVQKTPASGTQASNLSTMTEFSQKMVENLFNFASSYAVDPTQTALTAGETYVPASALRQWYTNFQRRLSANPNFWKAL